MTPPTEHPTPAQWAMIVAVRDIVERLDARPAGNLIGRRRGNDTQVVRLGE